MSIYQEYSGSREAYGELGEIFARDILEGNGYKAFYNKIIPHPRYKYGALEIDAIFYVNGQLFCLEVKRYKGKLLFPPRYADGCGDKIVGYDMSSIVQEKFDRKSGEYIYVKYPNPLGKTKYFIQHLKEYLSSLDPRFSNIFIHPVAAFVGGDSDISAIRSIETGIVYINEIPDVVYRRSNGNRNNSNDWILPFLEKLCEWDQIEFPYATFQKGVLACESIKYLSPDKKQLELNLAGVKNINFNHRGFFVKRTDVYVAYKGGKSDNFICRNGIVSMNCFGDLRYFPFREVKGIVFNTEDMRKFPGYDYVNREKKASQQNEKLSVKVPLAPKRWYLPLFFMLFIFFSVFLLVFYRKPIEKLTERVGSRFLSSYISISNNFEVKKKLNFKNIIQKKPAKIFVISEEDINANVKLARSYIDDGSVFTLEGEAFVGSVYQYLLEKIANIAFDEGKSSQLRREYGEMLFSLHGYSNNVLEYYNIARYFLEKDDKEKTYIWLSRMVDNGYPDFERISNDKVFLKIKRERQFKSLMKTMRYNANKLEKITKEFSEKFGGLRLYFDDRGIGYQLEERKPFVKDLLSLSVLIYEAGGGKQGQGMACFDVARFYALNGDYKNAVKYLKKASFYGGTFQWSDYISKEPGFDLIRDSKEFKDALAMIEAKKYNW